MFAPTTFLHVAHNLDPTYEGRVYPNVAEGALEHVHGLPRHLFVDPYWSGPIVVNPSRCALLTADSWATVSRSYKKDLLRSSPLSPILHLTPQPFGHPNGIPTASRRARLAALTENTHEAAKAALQRKVSSLPTQPGMGSGDWPRFSPGPLLRSTLEWSRTSLFRCTPLWAASRSRRACT